MRIALTAGLLFVLALTLACTSGSSSDLPPIEKYATFEFTLGKPPFMELEVADTAEEQQRGLMGRAKLPEDRGMLFEFGGETQTSFHMKDTPNSLSIAFIDASGKIIDIQDMERLTLTDHNPGVPYTQAIETNLGWFERNGVVVGSHVTIGRPTPT